MTTLLNILWFICGGWLSGTLWLLSGCLLALTIVGLPWAQAAWRIAGFAYFPFGAGPRVRNFEAFVNSYTENRRYSV